VYPLDFDYCHNDISEDIEMMKIENGLLRLRLIVFVLASQASHNTWTKRHSLVFYWANDYVLIGVPCSIGSLILSPFWVGDYVANHGGDVVVPIGTVVYTLSLSFTVLGILELVASKK
jgi:hypothetical protein